MKKLLLLTLTILLISSCGSTQSSSASKPSKKTLKGTWEITNIKFVGEKGLYKANLFDMADSACFKGSQWVFIPNNGSGKYTINDGSQCEGVATRIHWSFYEPGDGTYQFQFKYVDEKNKPIDSANRGYRSDIDSLDENTMLMRVRTSYEGNEFDVVLTYTKVSDDFAL
ncbi:lipocalin family protein [Lutimonas saemankumensis]|uniref:lipocalin family protein n=1 Tax=Lutimonas saemankumensis TaxID=483016 RepID=UPI001CD288AE|nr:lipocalin family protein [Lutimonas saemankumensis]MCA0931845.1 lipocalin family protein [Lutimonas saemankumensis]